MDEPNSNESTAGQEEDFSPLLSAASILIVDDEPGMRSFMMRMLLPRCRRVVEAADTMAAQRRIDETPFDLVILDNVMAGRTGIEWLRELRRSGFFGEVVLITAFADLETAIQALRAGASDFVLKPARANQILNAVARALDRARLRRDNFVLRRQLAAQPVTSAGTGTIVGRSEAMARLRAVVGRAAPLPTTVLITGESGTGKEVTARSLHFTSPRADKPFVPVNCAAIPPDMLESELFGHLRGAFTGAASAREGLFSYAQGGTLFLDEIGELPLPMQSKLLRVIEDKRVRPVGAEREVPVDVRLLAATNSDLARAVSEGRFRQDLFYRLAVLAIDIPPLRERPEDIEPLARLFMSDLSERLGMPPLSFTEDVLADLESYGWPGNARELRSVIERTLILGSFPGDLVVGAARRRPAREETLEAVEKNHILAVLDAAAGNKAEAARRLGVSRKTLDRKVAVWNG